MGVPANTTGNQYAHSGEGYAGIYTYGGPTETNGREYLRVELTEPIQAGVRYRVAFHASLADKFDYAVGSLGAHFSDTLITRASFNSLPGVEPDVQSPDGQVFSDKDIWYLITDTFWSRYGGERFLTIGNFKSTAESDTLFVPSNTPPRLKSYYYIDDVSVIALDSVSSSVAETEVLVFSVYPNPATDMLRIESTAPLQNLQLYNISGREVVALPLAKGVPEGRGISMHEVNISHLPPGIYILEALDIHGRKGTQRVAVH